MNLKQIKNVIFATECADIVRDGMFCSEPVATKDANDALVDNYFTYTVNRITGTVSGPHACFGIYSGRRQVAYIRLVNERKVTIKSDNLFDYKITNENRDYYYKEYENLFPNVRGFLYFEYCSQEEKQILRKYFHAFEGYVGITMMPLYFELAPSFFNWIQSQIGPNLDT